jgi:hypothetical protein
MTLEERVSKLEAENRMLKRAAATGVVVVAALLLMAQAKPSKVVEANQFVLRDSSGKTRLSIGLSTAGNTALEMLDSAGNLRSSVGPYGINFYDETGRMRTTLMSDLLYMSDERAHEIAHLQGDLHGVEFLLFSGTGDGSAVLRADPSGSLLKLTGGGVRRVVRPGEADANTR